VNRPDGGKTVRTQNGSTLQYNKTGRLDTVVTSRGTVARYNPQGGVRTIQTSNGTTVFRGPGGQRQITTVYRGPNGQINGRVVTTGPNRGYAERTYQTGGATYMRRTYVYGGHTTVAVYRGYPYRGVTYYRYVPPYYYRPAFYGWGYHPWGPPIVYTGWGWYGSPWYRSYGYYFAPYPVYPSAAFWLTDYLIAQNLQAAYAAQAAANANAAAANANAAAANANAAAAAEAQAQAGAPPPQQTADAQVTLTPEVKELISQEVQRQLAAQQAAAEQTSASGAAPAPDSQPPTTSTDDVPAALDPNLRVFVVTTSLDVTANDQPCTLSPGDVLMRTETTPDQNNTLAVNVVSSQKTDCAGGSTPRIQVADLQDMHNQFQEQLDTGLQSLAQNQGKDGIPTGPAADPRKNPDGTAAPDPTAAADLQKQQQDANQAEKEVQQDAPPAGGPGGTNQ
jgi:hypothetical protein